MDIFDGLEAFGLEGSFDYHDIFTKANQRDKGKRMEKAEKTIQPEDFLYQKSYVCPVCDLEFKETTVKKAKVRYISSEVDLKSHYEPFEPLYYDIVMCPYCGYAAILSLFHKLSSHQAELIHKQVTPKFKTKTYPLVLTVDMAIERYKLALLSAVTKSAGSGEKAYLCLKLAWLYRDKGDQEGEQLFLGNAYRGLKGAYSEENFPILGMDEPTVAYLIGELARRTGDYGEALKWIGNVIIRKNINTRLKDKAIDVKELIKADMAHASQRP